MPWAPAQGLRSSRNPFFWAHKRNTAKVRIELGDCAFLASLGSIWPGARPRSGQKVGSSKDSWAIGYVESHMPQWLAIYELIS